MGCSNCGAFCTRAENTCACRTKARDRALVREGLLIGLDSIIPRDEREKRIEKIVDDCIASVDGPKRRKQRSRP